MEHWEIHKYIEIKISLYVLNQCVEEEITWEINCLRMSGKWKQYSKIHGMGQKLHEEGNL
jgi:hypothetical protein